MQDSQKQASRMLERTVEDALFRSNSVLALSKKTGVPYNALKKVWDKSDFGSIKIEHIDALSEQAKSFKLNMFLVSKKQIGDIKCYPANLSDYLEIVLRSAPVMVGNEPWYELSGGVFFCLVLDGPEIGIWMATKEQLTEMGEH